MLPLLVAACPSFAGKWEEHKAEYFDEEDYLPYVALGALARHLIELHAIGNTSEFEQLFTVVERLHLEGEHYVREAATIGLLEGIQNIGGSESDAFYKYLQPMTARWWSELNKFWNGEIKYVGETISEDV